MSDDDPFKKKSFWYTLIGGMALSGLPAPLLAVLGYRGLKATGKGIGSLCAKAKALVAARQAVHAEVERRRQEAIAQELWEQGRPERESRQAEWQARRTQREGIRASCEFLYSLYGPEIAERFPRQEYQRFVDRFLNDARSIEEVIDYAARLQNLMQRHFDRVSPSPKITSLAALNNWYQDKRREIMESDADLATKQTHMHFLEERRDELMRLVIEEMMP